MYRWLFDLGTENGHVIDFQRVLVTDECDVSSYIVQFYKKLKYKSPFVGRWELLLTCETWLMVVQITCGNSEENYQFFKMILK